MKILLLSTYDQAGGAERVALDLFHTYRAAGHDARMLVRYRRTTSPDVVEADFYAHTVPWGAITAAADRWVAERKRFRGQYRLREWLQWAALPQRALDTLSGSDNIAHPYTRHLLDDPEWQPDVLHAHNLHGNYFDLQALPELSRRVPFVWTLHDMWALTGHCAYGIDCARWHSGCGSCPDLQRPPAIGRDNTHANWRRKQDLYAQSRLAIATPSYWLMHAVEESMLKPWQSRIVPYGVNLDVYHPGDRRQARAMLGLPQDAFICIYVAFSTSPSNRYKDATTVAQAVETVLARSEPINMLFVRIGGNAGQPSDKRFHNTGYLHDQNILSSYYRAADVLLHAANADNTPCVILEAMACGTPVIATAVGGVAEQIDEGTTGYLVPRADSAAMAQRLDQLVSQPDLAHQMGIHAARHARQNSNLEHQAAVYLEWFEQLQYAWREKVA